MTLLNRHTTLLIVFIASTLCASAQTVEFVAQIRPTGSSVVYNNLLFLSSGDVSTTNELWSTDGTTTGTSLVKSFSSSLFTTDFVAMNGLFYFIIKTKNPDTGSELWVSDGTTNGTTLIKNINSDPSATFTTLTVFNNKLYFDGNDGTNGEELWVSDGTTSGTQMIKNINPSGSGLNTIDFRPDPFVLYNSKIFFTANDGTNGAELWETDGTTGGTQMVKNINPAGSSGPRDFMVFNNNLFFRADDGTNGFELWVTNGTTAGTQMVKNIHPTGGSIFSFVSFKVFNNKLYFMADDGTNGEEPWSTDGTTAGTQIIKDIRSSGSSLDNNFRGFTEYNSKLYFNALDNTNGFELWETDGTTAGTQMFKNINSTSNSSPEDLIVVNNKLYFSAIDGTNGRELWITDGTDAGTQKLQPAISPNFNPLVGNEFVSTLYDNALYFGANYNNLGDVLWRVTDAPSATYNIAPENKLFAYPNPVQNQLHLQTEHPATITITDLYSRVVFSQSVVGTTTIDTQGWAAGLYHISSNTNHKSVSLVIGGQ